MSYCHLCEKRPLCLLLIVCCCSLTLYFLTGVYPWMQLLLWTCLRYDLFRVDCLFGDNCNAHVLSKTAMMMALLKMKTMQAFEHPFDMSCYLDVCDDDHPSNMHDHIHVDCTHSSGRVDCSTISTSRSNTTLDEQHDNPQEDAKAHGSSSETVNKKAWLVCIIFYVSLLDNITYGILSKIPLHCLLNLTLNIYISNRMKITRHTARSLLAATWEHPKV